MERAGGAATVARRIAMPYSTLQRYLNGRDMKAPALVALARATAVNIEWLAAGTGPEHAEHYDPLLLGQLPQGPLPEGCGVAVGPAMPLPGHHLGAPKAPPQAPVIDPEILVKAIEIVDGFLSSSAAHPDALERARHIARAYAVLVSPPPRGEP
ncbi:MAG: helix-turn-helix transcriptional regulator [Rhodospirillales bacterium]|nr:helix-turn-helix transcriptional regulator [Rhodospirillales bacterium]